MENNLELKSDKHDKKLIIVCCICLSLVGFIQAYMGAAMPFIRDDLLLSTPMVAWHFSLYALGRLSSGYIVTINPKLATGIKAILIFSFSLIGFATLLVISNSVFHTLPLAYCIGLSGGTAQALTQIQIGTMRDKAREVALAHALVWAGVGSMIAPLMIGWLSRQGNSWGFVLFIPLIFAIVMFVTGKSLFLFTSAIEKNIIKSKISVTVIIFWILVVCGNALEWGIGFWGAQYIELKHSISTSTSVYLMSFFFAGIIVGRIINVYLVKIYDCDVLYAICVFVTGIAFCFMIFSMHLYFVSTGIFAAGTAIGCLYPNNMSTAMKYAPNEILRIATGAAKCSGLSLLIFPLTMGYLGSEIGLESAFRILLIFPPIMLALVTVIRKYNRKFTS